MTFDPYQILDVPRDAPSAAIKRAYRKKAKTLHPDAGGTAEEFSRLAKANLILADPARRARFDRDGSFDESPDNSFAKAISICVGFFASAVEQHVRSGAPDPLTLPLIQFARKAFRDEIVKYKTQKVPIEAAREKLQAVEARLHAKAGANSLLSCALKMQAESTVEPLAAIDRQIAAYRDALAILDGYEYTPDVGVPGQLRVFWNCQ